MPAFRRMFALALVCLATLCAAQDANQVAAARVLGPRWIQISRSAGMIFSGTVLKVEAQRAGKNFPLPLNVIEFKVDRGMAGVQSGQVLRIREWAGAWSMHRPMFGGQRLLIFLYPASRLGLTSPVGGSEGQVLLDSRGEIAGTAAEFAEGVHSQASGAEAHPESGLIAAVNRCATQNQTLSAMCDGRRDERGLIAAVNRCATQNPKLGDCAAAQPIVTLLQLERAILDVRKTKE